MNKRTIRLDHPRIAFSVEAIKDALLVLLKKNNYSDITVTDLCRQACISRGTFYVHFNHIGEVADLILDDVLKRIGNVPLQLLCKNEDKRCEGLPLCMVLRSNRKYIPLFLSDMLFNHVVERTVDYLWDGFRSIMKERTGMEEDLIHDLLYYQISGCMAVFGRHLNVSDEEWERRRCNVDDFLKNGFGLTSFP